MVVGKQPDGDSIRFVPDTPDLLEDLRRGWRVRRSSDGSVQLRLEGIDAPETHYGALAQPLGARARDALLELCGFSEIRRDEEEVVSATPERRPAAVRRTLSAYSAQVIEKASSLSRRAQRSGCPCAVV